MIVKDSEELKPMSYSDFTLELLRRTFSITARDGNLFESIGHLEPPSWLRQAFVSGSGLPFISEKARSEFIVAPILVACRELCKQKFQVFSGVRLDADSERGLKGECDFIIARSLSSYSFQSPLLLVLEAKKNYIEEGLGQCAAQMLGALIYNEKDHQPLPYLYGCVTTGEAWQFLKLEGDQLTIHPERFLLEDVGKILWLLVECLQDLDRRAPKEAAA